MRLLVFADVHLDAPFRWAGPRLGRSRRQALRQTVRNICALAVSERADALLCAGDLYEHERVTPDTAQFLRGCFSDLELPVFLAPGNHDWYGPTSLYAELPWPGNVHVFRDDQLRAVELIDGLTLWGAAHRAPANTDGFLGGFRVDRAGVHLALFHGSERGGLAAQGSGKVPHAPFAAADIERCGLHHAFVGHFHSPRDDLWLTYPGNPEPLAFGEGGERGAVIVEVLADGRVCRTRHRVAVTEVSSVTVDVTGADHVDLVRDQVTDAVSGLAGIVRVTLQGDHRPDLDLQLSDLDGIGDHLEALVPRFGRLGTTDDLASLALENTVRGEFVRCVQADPSLDELTRGRVLLAGLRALDGRLADLAVW